MENKPKHFSGIQNLLTMIDLSAVRKDCEIVHLICAAVSRRAAYMCAAGISAIARKISSSVYYCHYLISKGIINFTEWVISKIGRRNRFRGDLFSK